MYDKLILGVTLILGLATSSYQLPAYYPNYYPNSGLPSYAAQTFNAYVPNYQNAYKTPNYVANYQYTEDQPSKTQNENDENEVSDTDETSIVNSRINKYVAVDNIQVSNIIDALQQIPKIAKYNNFEIIKQSKEYLKRNLCTKVFSNYKSTQTLTEKDLHPDAILQEINRLEKIINKTSEEWGQALNEKLDNQFILMPFFNKDYSNNPQYYQEKYRKIQERYNRLQIEYNQVFNNLRGYFKSVCNVIQY